MPNAKVRSPDPQPHLSAAFDRVCELLKETFPGCIINSNDNDHTGILWKIVFYRLDERSTWVTGPHARLSGWFRHHGFVLKHDLRFNVIPRTDFIPNTDIIYVELIG